MKKEIDPNAWIHPTLKRYVKFEYTPHLLRGRFSIPFWTAIGGFVLSVMRFRDPHPGSGILSQPFIAPLLTVAGIVAVLYTFYEKHRFIQSIEIKALFRAAVVIADTRMGGVRVDNSPCWIIFTFQSDYMSNTDFLMEVAGRLRELIKAELTDQIDRNIDDIFIKILSLPEGTLLLPFTRIVLPLELTNGVKVMLNRPMFEARLLKNRKFQSDILYCIAEEGEEGIVDVIPWQVVVEESKVLMN